MSMLSDPPRAPVPPGCEALYQTFRVALDEFTAVTAAANAFGSQFVPGTIVTFTPEQGEEYNRLRDRVQRAGEEWNRSFQAWADRCGPFRTLSFNE